MLLRRHYLNRELGGPNKILEMDQSKFKRKSGVGRLPATSGWVFGITERGIGGRSFFQVVENRTAETLVPIINLRARADSPLVCSDSFRSYQTLRGHGYNHHMVNHSRNFVRPRRAQCLINGENTLLTVHTQTIQRRWGILKSFLRKRSGVSIMTLQDRINEAQFLMENRGNLVEAGITLLRRYQWQVNPYDF